jgi:hypothetical protein
MIQAEVFVSATCARMVQADVFASPMYTPTIWANTFVPKTRPISKGLALKVPFAPEQGQPSGGSDPQLGGFVQRQLMRVGHTWDVELSIEQV